MGYFFGLLLSLLAVFLILLVLVQRGRGGGLAGALGGMGGSSAFGAKAGDVFTRITIYVVVVWIVACILAGHWARNRRDPLTGAGTITPPSSSAELPVTPPFNPLPSSDPAMPGAPTGGPQLGSPSGGPAAAPGAAPAATTTDEAKSETPDADK